MARPKADKRASRKSPSRKSAGSVIAGSKPWSFPKNTLEDAIEIAKASREFFNGTPTPARFLADAIGYHRMDDKSFADLLRSAKQYGLVKGQGSASIHLAEIGRDIVAPSSRQQRSYALRNAFLRVKDFKAVERFYSGKHIPEDEFFLNTLVREFKIPADRVDRFAEVFRANVRYLSAFSATDISAELPPATTESSASGVLAEGISTAVGPQEPRARTFLDTCFVMMPFGDWFDRYYVEIYVPAIKDAGFEPVRADELFTTGSVVEQIWEQIDKAKLLLADLSGKNPNVFYELGLAHAARKPVIFTAGAIDDVPFDLRHLRVITYEVREPEWASRLRRSISDYLRNATKEPGKSIPHPFRKMAEDEHDAQGRSGRHI